MSAVLKEQPRISLIGSGVDVAPLAAKLAAHPELWNQHTLRTENYSGPHSQVSDIWVRYNPFENFTGDREAFNGPHESEWYPCADLLAIKPMVLDLMRIVDGTRLGGVLITKIPAHGKCLPHVDNGWHARHYYKFAIQIAANDQQAFCFDGERLVTKPGDVFTFDNSFTHWVDNDSDEDRITLICCIRG